MSRRQYCLYLDEATFEIVRSSRKNISRFVDAVLQVEAGVKDEEGKDITMELRLSNARLIEQIRNKNIIIKELEKELEQKESKEEKKESNIEYIPEREVSPYAAYVRKLK